jgi:hypothetical protein
MNTKCLILLTIVAATLFCRAAETDVVYKTVVSTNWIYPSPQYRYVDKQLVNVDTYRSFETVSLPPTWTVYTPYIGPVDSTIHYLEVQVSGYVRHSADNAESWVLEFKNYAFIRNQWTFEKQSWKPLGGGNFLTRAILIDTRTNYYISGDIKDVYKTYDCGTPLTKPVCLLITNTASALKLAAEKAAAAKKTTQAKVVKWNQEQADKGDPTALLRMGEFYRDGNGVPKDLDKAREYLTKASAAGSPNAADELSKLNQGPTNATANP